MNLSLSKDTVINENILKKIFEKTSADKAKMQTLLDYYLGKHKILDKVVEDKSKPNYKIVHPYGSYITDTLCGYFMGEPVTYSSIDEELHNELAAILAENNVASIDMELARDASIFGKSYELHYVDEEGRSKFAKLSPLDVIIIYDDSIAKDILFAIRAIETYDIETDKKNYRVEVYSQEDVSYYVANSALTSFTFMEAVPHYFGIVPIVEYKNNENELGDFEPIIPLIDAYDTLESDALNDFDFFVDAYLLLTGLDADAEDIAAMKENRVILLDDTSARAEWLIKSENDTVSKNLKDRFNSDIHKFSKTPDLSDEKFSSNASGVAIKYKLYGTETLVSNKERFFKRGLERRLRLIFNILSVKGSAYDWRAVDIQFTRNLPTNETEIADVVSKLSGIVSIETLLSQIPFITDTKKELERLEQDKELNPFYSLEQELMGTKTKTETEDTDNV